LLNSIIISCDQEKYTPLYKYYNLEENYEELKSNMDEQHNVLKKQYELLKNDLEKHHNELKNKSDFLSKQIVFLKENDKILKNEIEKNSNFLSQIDKGFILERSIYKVQEQNVLKIYFENLCNEESLIAELKPGYYIKVIGCSTTKTKTSLIEWCYVQFLLNGLDYYGYIKSKQIDKQLLKENTISKLEYKKASFNSKHIKIYVINPISNKLKYKNISKLGVYIETKSSKTKSKIFNFLRKVSGIVEIEDYSKFENIIDIYRKYDIHGFMSVQINNDNIVRFIFYDRNEIQLWDYFLDIESIQINFNRN